MPQFAITTSKLEKIVFNSKNLTSSNMNYRCHGQTPSKANEELTKL